MLIADDITQLGDFREKLEVRQKSLWQTLEGDGQKIRREKIEYMDLLEEVEG